MMRPSTIDAGFGVIRADEIMPLREAARRLGFGYKTVVKAQRAGLRTVEFGRMKYVSGADVLEWFARLAEEQNGQSAGGRDATD